MIATWDTTRIDREACTGCRVCEIICSLGHEQVVNPDKARVFVRRRYEESLYIPYLCQNCVNPDCVAVCPAGALSQGVDGVVLADQVQCTGCELCVQACPHEAVRYNEATSRILVCDRCGGKPLCVEFCATQAVQYAISS